MIAEQSKPHSVHLAVVGVVEKPGLEMSGDVVRELAAGEFLRDPLFVQQRHLYMSLGGSVGDEAVPTHIGQKLGRVETKQ